MITTQNTESIDTSFISYSVSFTIVSDVRIFSNSWIVASLHLKIYILETTYTPIMKYKDLNVFSTSLTYLVKSICCLTFYLIKYSKSTSQFLIYCSLFTKKNLNLLGFFTDKNSVLLLCGMTESSISSIKSLLLNDFSHAYITIKLWSSTDWAN